MTDNTSNIVENFKQGNSNALAILLNKKLSSKDITAKVSVKNDCLIVLFQSSQSLPEKYLVQLIRKLIDKMNYHPWNKVTIYGQIIGEEIPDWVEVINIKSSHQSVEEQAKQGNISAISWLVNQNLEAPGIVAKVSLKNYELRIMLESESVPEQTEMSFQIKRIIEKLQIPNLNSIQIYGKQKEEIFPDWHQTIMPINEQIQAHFLNNNMQNDKINKKLDRIAIALESIAYSLADQSEIALQEKTRDKGSEEIGFINEEVSENGEENYSQELEENTIRDFLTSRNIEIKTVPEENAKDDVINSLADFLGNHYSALNEILSRIKSQMQKGASFKFYIGNYTQQEISQICNFCTRLYRLAFLEEYNYQKSPHFLITAKTTTLATAQIFLSGQWLERFVLQTVKEAINIISDETGKYIDFSYLLNPQIKLPNGNDFELDLIFHLNQSIYWIEAKTGDYQRHIQKYSRMSEIFNLDYKHSIMVLPDIPEDTSSDLTSLFFMTVYNLSQFKMGLMETMRNDVNAS